MRAVAPASPCTGICTLDAAGAICTGCGRSLPEIASWSTMTAAQRDAVLARLAARDCSAPN